MEDEEDLNAMKDDFESVKFTEEKHNIVSNGTSTDVRIGVIGNVDSGKSTLVGVLVSGELDDGRGAARSKVFRFKHEQDNGRTSSISHHIMGFGANGEPVYQTAVASAAPNAKTKSWQRIVENSSSIVTFIDLCGHEKYLKTTIAGLTGNAPHYACVLVGGNMGVQKMTKEHIGVAVALNIPFFVVVTKVDLAPEKILRKTLKDLFKILKHPQCGKMPILIKKEEDTNMCFENTQGILQQRICPVFLVSSVKGTNIPVLKSFLSKLQVAKPVVEGDEKDASLPVVQIDETFTVTGVGTVISGIVQKGVLKQNEQLLLGPFTDGEFRPIIIRSIHLKRTLVETAETGSSCAVAIRGKNLRRDQVRRGMVIVHPDLEPQPIWGFQAEVLVLHHPTTIKTDYQCVIHCNSTRQACAMEIELNRALRTGDRAHVRFDFLYWPEWISIGDTVVFREGSTKGIGKVQRIYTERRELKKHNTDVSLEIEAASAISEVHL